MFLSVEMSTHFFYSNDFRIDGSKSRMLSTLNERLFTKLLNKIPKLEFPENSQSLHNYREKTFLKILKTPERFAPFQSKITQGYIEQFKGKPAVVFELIVLNELFANQNLIEAFRKRAVTSSIGTTPPLTKLFKRICRSCIEAGILQKAPDSMPQIRTSDELEVLLNNFYNSLYAVMEKMNLDGEEESDVKTHRTITLPRPIQSDLLDKIRINPLSRTALMELLETLYEGEVIELPDGRRLDDSGLLTESKKTPQDLYEVYFNKLLVMKKDDVIELKDGHKLNRLAMSVRVMQLDPARPFAYVIACESMNSTMTVNIPGIGFRLTQKDLAVRAVECQQKIPEALNMLASLMAPEEQIFNSSYGRFLTKRDLYLQSILLDPSNQDANTALGGSAKDKSEMFELYVTALLANVEMANGEKP